jgi:hypothetical protein
VDGPGGLVIISAASPVGESFRGYPMPNVCRVLLAVGFCVLMASAAVPAAAAAAAAPAKPASPPAKAGDVPEVNRKVLAYCAAHLDQQVADGECANLVNEAYKAAGAKRHREVPKPPGVTLQDDDYVWGRLLGPTDEVLPGDVIQFRDVKIVKKTGSRTSTHTMAHHTAVVQKVLGKNHYAVLHQNSSVGVPPEKKKTVHPGDIDLNFKTAGEAWVYRPLAGESQK